MAQQLASTKPATDLSTAHTIFYGFKRISRLVASQVEMAALEARMQAVQAKLLRAKAESSRLASVNMQYLSCNRAATNFLSSEVSEFPQNSDKAQRRECERRGVSGTDVEPVPTVVGSFSSPKRNTTKLLFDCDSLLFLRWCRFHSTTAPARLFVLLLLQCERDSVQPAAFKVMHFFRMYKLIA